MISDSEIENVTLSLGLHEHLEITYIVDGFHIALLQHDGQSIKYETAGRSILEALMNLDTLIGESK